MQGRTIGSAVYLNLKVDKVGRSLEDEDQNSEIASILVHLLTSALTFALHFLERRENHTAELDNDARRDIGHDTQGENRSLRERSAREHIKKLHQSALVGEIGKSVDICWRNARQHHITTQAVYQYQQECYENALTQLLDSPDIF